LILYKLLLNILCNNHIQLILLGTGKNLQTKQTFNYIYEHTLVQDKLYSWNRLIILGDGDYKHRFTIPAIDPDQETYWNPAKHTVLFGSAIAADTALAYGAHNFLFAGSTLRLDQPFYAQLSLHTINN